MLIDLSIKLRRVKSSYSCLWDPVLSSLTALTVHSDLESVLGAYPTCAALNNIIYQVISKVPLVATGYAFRLLE